MLKYSITNMLNVQIQIMAGVFKEVSDCVSSNWKTYFHDYAYWRGSSPKWPYSYEISVPGFKAFNREIAAIEKAIESGFSALHNCGSENVSAQRTFQRQQRGHRDGSGFEAIVEGSGAGTARLKVMS